MKRNLWVLLLISLLFSNPSYFNNYSIRANSIPPQVEVLLDNEVTGGNRLGQTNTNIGFSIWHYSDKQWKFNLNGIQFAIPDQVLGKYLDDPTGYTQIFESYIPEYTNELQLSDTLDSKIKNAANLKMVVSTSKSDISIKELFLENTIKVELQGNKLRFSGKPKINFLWGRSYQSTYHFDTDIDIPLVNPIFGRNVYSIWKKDGSDSYGSANGYLDTSNLNASAPEGSGMIAPAQIIDNQGHLKSGFNFETTKDNVTTERSSDTTSVGYGTFKSGGAVGISMHYPLVFTFYEDSNDLSVHYSLLPSGAAAGDDVLVGINVESSFKNKQGEVDFEWEMKTVSGKVLKTAVLHGNAEVEPNTYYHGKIPEIPAAGEGQAVIYASFQMPSEDVELNFTVNRTGESTAPDEKFMLNNSLSATIHRIEALPPVSGEFDLDYNILSRQIAYPLSDSDIIAQLNSSITDWLGPARGNLNVVRDNGGDSYLRDFQVENNPAVNESSTTIIRRPQLQATLRRIDFGDNPIYGDWLPWSNPNVPKTREEPVSASGNVSRDYQYQVRVECKPKADEEEVGENLNQECWDTRTATDSTVFHPLTNTQTIRTFIYHGQPMIPPKTYIDRIDNNTLTSLQKNLSWTSELYKINVIRWMYHMNESGGLYGATAVNGQYQRHFTQQNTGYVRWAAINTMQDGYRKSRDAAKVAHQSGRGTNKEDTEKAVFATEKTLQTLPYPIKSGYYFNPTGTYEFVVETVTYKPTSADTQDHKALVDAVIRSFRYETDLMYINNDQEAVNIQNERLPANGKGSYGRRPAALTVQDPTGVDGVLMLNVLDRSDSEARYDKDIEELEHAQTESGQTDDRWKNILEGYAQSGTSSSKTNYKYQEFVKNGQRMYKITERTRVTIQVNPGDRKVYTHAHMPNGDYRVKVWVGDIALSNLEQEYRKLGTLRGITSLDEIEVNVVGSMYDDLD